MSFFAAEEGLEQVRPRLQLMLSRRVVSYGLGPRRNCIHEFASSCSYAMNSLSAIRRRRACTRAGDSKVACGLPVRSGRSRASRALSMRGIKA